MFYLVHRLYILHFMYVLNVKWYIRKCRKFYCLATRNEESEEVQDYLYENQENVDPMDEESALTSQGMLA